MTSASHSKIVCNTFAPDPYSSSSSSKYGVSTPGPEFGWSVAINCDGSQILVGSANDPAAVYMYNGNNGQAVTTINGKQYTTNYPEELLLKVFHNPHGAHAERDGIQSQFGLSLTMNVNGQRILIGDPALEVVYLYDDRGHLLHTFQEYGFDSMFGASLAISDDGTVIAIGAPESYTRGNNHGGAGAVYLFHQLDEENPTKWDLLGNENKQPIYKPGKPTNNENFGISLALSPDGSLLLVGAWQANVSAGAAYLFQIPTQRKEETGESSDDYSINKNASVAVTNHIFLNPDKEGSTGFGWAVDLTEDYVVIGARGAGRDSKWNAGAVYVYSLQAARENYSVKLPVLDTISMPMPVENDEFGGALSAAGNRLLVASYAHGTAYWYERENVYIEAQQTNRTYYVLKEQIAIPSIPSTSSTSFYGASVALSRNGEKGVVGVPRALGRNGYSTTGTAMGLCLPEPSMEEGMVANYTCPDLQLPALTWTSAAFWLSWDSNSGKILGFVATIIVCLFILCYGTKRQPQQRRHRFHLLSTEAVNDNELELQVIQENSEFL